MLNDLDDVERGLEDCQDEEDEKVTGACSVPCIVSSLFQTPFEFSLNPLHPLNLLHQRPKTIANV
jgi:hypothetical protein